MLSRSSAPTPGWRALLLTAPVALWLGCWNFEGVIAERCQDGGLTQCPVPPDAGRDAGADAGRGAGGGQGGGAADSDGGICFNGFCWENPQPQGNPLNAVWGSPAGDDVWAVGDVGTALRWRGGHFTSYQSSFLQNISLQSVWGANGHVWVVGTPGENEAQVHMSPMHFDGGRFDPVPFPLGSVAQPDLLSIRGSDENDVWVSGLSGAIAHRVGGAWQVRQFEQGGTGVALPAIAVDSEGGCMVSLNNDLRGVAPCDGGGLELTLGADDLPARNGLWAVSAGRFGLAVSHASPDLSTSGAVYARATDGGWAPEYAGDSGTACTAGATFGATQLAWCGNGTLLSGVPLAPSTPASLAGDDQLSGVWTPGSLQGSWLVGRGGELIRHDGTDWQHLESGPKDVIWGLWVDAQRVLGVGGNGLVFTRQGDGAWSTAQLAGVSSDLRDVWVSPSDDQRVMVGASRRLVEVNATAVSQAAGVPISTSDVDQLNAVWGTASGELWAVGTNSEVWHRVDGGWSAGGSRDGGATLWDLDGTDPAHLFAVGDDCTVLHHEVSDGGWNREPVPAGCGDTLYGVWAAPANDAGLDAVAVGRNAIWLRLRGTWAASARLTTAQLYKVWGTSPTDIWAVGQAGLALHFDGGSWTAVETGTRQGLEAVGGRVVGGSLQLWLAGGNGTVLRHGSAP